MSKKYFGKYRGMVLNNVDPMQMGRLQVQVPDVAGLLPSSWAMPCFPFAGKQMGMYCLPQIGAGVWIYIQNGKGASITLVGPTVTVNAGALTVN